jgi:deazaflavin-dependent oxidoreductase (nitroreductase family)
MTSHERTRGRIARALRWPVGILGAFLFIVLSPYVVLLIFVIALKELKRFREWMRLFNKRTLNPAILKFAGQKGKIYSVVHHVGRRSGKSYTTPVAAALTADGFVIPLPYGKDVDWCRNVLAAGQCTIEHRGEHYTVGEPEVIDGATALTIIQPAERLVWRALGINKDQFLRVKMLASTQDTVPPASFEPQPVMQ